MRFFLFALMVFYAAPVLAQETVPAAPAGEGKRERFTEAQSEAIALKQMPGEVIATDSNWENGRFYHEFTIQRPGGSIYEVEVSADTGEIYQIEVESLGDLSDLPAGLTDRDLAAKTAASYIESETKGLGSPHLQSATTGVYQRKIAYVFRIQKATRVYEVVVNAMDGRVIDTRQID